MKLVPRLRKHPYLFILASIVVLVGILRLEAGLPGGPTQPLNLPGKITFQSDRKHVEIAGAWYESTFLLENGQMRALLPGGSARFSKDGKKIIYNRRDPLYLQDLATLKTDTLEWTRVYAPFDFDLSPDQQLIAFTSHHVQFSKYKVPQLNLMVAKLDGSEVKQLTDVREGIYGPRWSPDGKNLIFYTGIDPASESGKDPGGIYLVDMLTGNFGKLP